MSVEITCDAKDCDARCEFDGSLPLKWTEIQLRARAFEVGNILTAHACSADHLHQVLIGIASVHTEKK